MIEDDGRSLKSCAFTGNVDQVCFWDIATPVTPERDPSVPDMGLN